MNGSTELLPHQFHMLPDGGRMRYALVEPSQKPRGTILVAPGRREFIEKKYAEVGKEFLQRGFRLIFFDWRGHGLSSRFLTGSQRQRDYVTDFSAYLDDLHSLYEDAVRPNLTGPLLLCGHSMGGHIFLRWLAERQKTGVDAVILTAPMLALGPRVAHSFAEIVMRTAVKLGHGANYGPGQHDYSTHERNFSGNPLTQDAERFSIIERYFDAYPDMLVGGVTWEWLSAALKSMHELRRVHYLEQVTVPVLTMMGSGDHVTPAQELMRYLSRLPNGQNIIIPGAYHDILNEIEILRLEAWRQIDSFLIARGLST